MKLIGSENFCSASNWGRNNSAPRIFFLHFFYVFFVLFVFFTIIILKCAAIESFRGCVFDCVLKQIFTMNLSHIHAWGKQKTTNFELTKGKSNYIYMNLIAKNKFPQNYWAIWTSNTFFTNQQRYCCSVCTLLENIYIHDWFDNAHWSGK